MKRMWTLAAIAVAFVGGFGARGWMPVEPVVQAQQAGRFYELRTFTANEGKLEALDQRFRDHTMSLWAKHGMTNVAYFKVLDSPAAANQIVFLLSYPSREASKASWASFGQDAEWKKVVAESEANGKLIAKGETIALAPTDYSPMK